MLISGLLKISHKKTCKKSYEWNSQIEVHFLTFTHTKFKFFVCNVFFVNFFAVSETALYSESAIF